MFGQSSCKNIDATSQRIIYSIFRYNLTIFGQHLYHNTLTHCSIIRFLSPNRNGLLLLMCRPFCLLNLEEIVIDFASASYDTSTQQNPQPIQKIRNEKKRKEKPNPTNIFRPSDMRSGVINYDPLEFPRNRTKPHCHFSYEFSLSDSYQVI